MREDFGGATPHFYIIVYFCLGPNPCISTDVLVDVTLLPTQDCHLMCLFEPTSRLAYSPSNGLLTHSEYPFLGGYYAQFFFIKTGGQKSLSDFFVSEN